MVLDKVVCPYLVKYLEMPIWHPTSEKTLDELLAAWGDQFRPAIRAGWLSYICRVYPHDGAPDAGLVVGEGTFVVQE